MIKKVSNDKFAIASYDESKKLLLVRFNGIINRDSAMGHFFAVEKYAQSNKIVAIIADLTKLRGSFVKFMDYFENAGYPVLIKNGLKAEAIIVSDDLIIRHLSDKLRSLLIKMGLQCRIFEKEEAANEWISQFVEH